MAKEPFVETRCNSFDKFLKKAEALLKLHDQWIFRGQRMADWPLKTKLERACERFMVPAVKRADIERRMIREFQRRLHHYTPNVPDRDTWDEWMALMQHHGAPTRLLDFSYSPYVAAYFAFEDSERNSEVALWAVNTDWCERELELQFNSLYTKYISYAKERKPQDFIDLIKPGKKVVLSVNPFRLNERLAYQRAVFLCPGDVATGFMENMSGFMGKKRPDDKVIKFIISTGKDGETRNEALERLDQMNMNRITLFPGLDGFAQSFSARIPSLFLKQRW